LSIKLISELQKEISEAGSASVCRQRST